MSNKHANKIMHACRHSHNCTGELYHLNQIMEKTMLLSEDDVQVDDPEMSYVETYFPPAITQKFQVNEELVEPLD